MALWETMGFSPRSQRHDLDSLTEHVEHLELLVKALSTLCHQHGVFNEKEFQDMRDFIDLQDGTLDGKNKQQAKARLCPKCKKKISPTAKKCMWCEADLLPA